MVVHPFPWPGLGIHFSMLMLEVQSRYEKRNQISYVSDGTHGSHGTSCPHFGRKVIEISLVSVSNIIIACWFGIKVVLYLQFQSSPCGFNSCLTHLLNICNFGVGLCCLCSYYIFVNLVAQA